MGEEVSLCSLERLLKLRPKLPDRVIVTEINDLPVNESPERDVQLLAFLVPLLYRRQVAKNVKRSVALKVCAIYEGHEYLSLGDKAKYVKELLQWLSCRGNCIFGHHDAVWKFLARLWDESDANLRLLGIDRSLIAQAVIEQEDYSTIQMLLPSANEQMFFFIFYLWKTITTDEQGRRRTFMEASKNVLINSAVGELIRLCAHVLESSQITDILNAQKSKLAKIDRMLGLLVTKIEGRSSSC